MKSLISKMALALYVMFICVYIAGCASMPLKENGLAIGKDTTAGIDDIGVGRVTKQF